MFAEVQSDLVKVAKSAKAPAARVAGVEALAVVCFCCSEDPQSTVETMEVLQDMWRPGVCVWEAGTGCCGASNSQQC
jgi:hypothetical protein